MSQKEIPHGSQGRDPAEVCVVWQEVVNKNPESERGQEVGEKVTDRLMRARTCEHRMQLGALSGHILCVFPISFYGPLAELELRRETA